MKNFSQGKQAETDYFTNMAPVNNIPAFEELQNILSDRQLFSAMDKHFAMFIGRLAREHKPEAALAAALVSRETREGNICLDLADFAEKPLATDARIPCRDVFTCPALPEWHTKLLQSGVISHDAENTPLVLDQNGRLYLRRYWEYENSIISFIRQRTRAITADLDHPRLAADLQKLFQPLPAGEIDWQQVAAIAAAHRPFCVISGGPGTGKTFTVASILALFSSQYNNTGQPPRILLGAPTGKAASRLQQAIADTGLLQSGWAETVQATTLHRMLGYVPNSPYFRHNAKNPLAADMVIIDEASMVDLPLMAKLMQAVPTTARLILLGDRHQLASVQPGSVLGDICNAEIMMSFSAEFCKLTEKISGITLEPSSSPGTTNVSASLQDSFVELMHSHRFKPDSAIARLSLAVREGDWEGALVLLQGADDDSIAWSEIPASGQLGKKLQSWPGVVRSNSLQPPLDPEACFSLLENFRILCALRNGPFGTERINTLVAQQLTEQSSDAAGGPIARQFIGEAAVLPFRPVMVTENDYNLRLFNGDVGILLPDPENRGAMRAFFKDEAGQLRTLSSSMLPGYETVFGMTVHKSQGSEFDRVLLILPDRDSPLLTRELLYTAITRARKTVEIWSSREIFAAAVKRQITRTSGLAEALWGNDP